MAPSPTGLTSEVLRFYTVVGQTSETPSANEWALDLVSGFDRLRNLSYFLTGSVPGPPGPTVAPEGRKSVDEMGPNLYLYLSQGLRGLWIERVSLTIT